MLEKKSEFKIKRFKSSKDKEFLDALIIYSNTIAPEIKTNTNEITYWIDKFNEKFSDKELYIFGLYYNEKLIGYSQLVYFKNDKFVFIDYLCLNDPYKKNAIFYPLYNLIETYLIEERCDYKYIITEVSYTENNLDIDEASILLLNLLFMENYGIADAMYYQPLLGLDNQESNFENKLMIKSNEPIRKMKKETYLNIVETIYKKHYLCWYEPLLDTNDNYKQYEKHINKLFENVKNKNKHDISVFDTYSKIYGDREIIISSRENYSTASPIKEAKTKNSDIKVSLLILGFLLIINIALWIFCIKFNVDFKYFCTSLVVIIISLLIFLSLFSQKAESILSKIPNMFSFLWKK